MRSIDDYIKVMQTASTESTLRPPTMTERVRTTISLTPEALEIFKRMAAAGNMSVSRCMGDWLTDTSDAAEMIASKMEDARRAPLRVMRELRAMVSGMGSEVDTIMAEFRKPKGGVVSPLDPPSSNTGVLVPPVPSYPKPPRTKKSRVKS
jgi:hypothetical protein